MTDLDEVGTLSDSATLLRHNTTKRLPTPGLEHYHYISLFSGSRYGIS
jgi:hypothetical protein